MAFGIRCHLSILMMLLALAACNTKNSQPKEEPEGGEKSAKTQTLETGAKVLQRETPLGQMDIYLVGFHPMKDNSQIQMEAHHYCHQVNEDFAQCVLFDGNTKNAQMNGIEYIVSEKLYNSLPAGEKQYWHPHNYEILSGELVGPGLPDAAEHSLMALKMNSYGKTWHLWMTDSQGKPGDKLPLGPPHLAWSFNHDGELAPGMMESRDQKMGIDSKQKRNDRADLSGQAHPQGGVDVLKKTFPNGDGAPDGVRDAGTAPQ